MHQLGVQALNTRAAPLTPGRARPSAAPYRASPARAPTLRGPLRRCPRGGRATAQSLRRWPACSGTKQDAEQVLRRRPRAVAIRRARARGPGHAQPGDDLSHDGILARELPRDAPPDPARAARLPLLLLLFIPLATRRRCRLPNSSMRVRSNTPSGAGCERCVPPAQGRGRGPTLCPLPQALRTASPGSSAAPLLPPLPPLPPCHPCPPPPDPAADCPHLPQVGSRRVSSSPSAAAHAPPPTVAAAAPALKHPSPCARNNPTAEPCIRTQPRACGVRREGLPEGLAIVIPYPHRAECPAAASADGSVAGLARSDDVAAEPTLVAAPPARRT